MSRNISEINLLYLSCGGSSHPVDELAELDFPPLLLLEYPDGPLYHIDMLADNGELKKAVVSHRVEERFGFSLECDQRPKSVDLAETVISELGLNYNWFLV